MSRSRRELHHNPRLQPQRCRRSLRSQVSRFVHIHRQMLASFPRDLAQLFDVRCLHIKPSLPHDDRQTPAHLATVPTKEKHIAEQREKRRSHAPPIAGDDPLPPAHSFYTFPNFCANAHFSGRPTTFSPLPHSNLENLENLEILEILEYFLSIHPKRDAHPFSCRIFCDRPRFCRRVPCDAKPHLRRGIPPFNFLLPPTNHSHFLDSQPSNTNLATMPFAHGQYQEPQAPGRRQFSTFLAPRSSPRQPSATSVSQPSRNRREPRGIQLPREPRSLRARRSPFGLRENAHPRTPLLEFLTGTQADSRAVEAFIRRPYNALAIFGHLSAILETCDVQLV
jgi:hypothetical protein